MDLDVPYNRDLRSLETLLEGVQRGGDFAVQGALQLPMPRVEVDGAGVLSFPVPEPQVRQAIAEAEQAPYGRGEQTVLDTSVRSVWQLPADRVRIQGTSWERSFRRIRSTVASALGLTGTRISAELYKLLIYDEGGFFKAHRDTEKAEGMFGTLILVLPSWHRGGELVVRHGGGEKVIDLSGGDVSEITFAAFYADCEHEVRPIAAGNRVCLVYNLVQPRAKQKDKPRLTAPQYDTEVAHASEILEPALLSPDAPTKLAWLLEHQYSPAGLSFAGLKGVDAGRVQVLRRAAEEARCAVHLGIVHIEEEGSAEWWGDYYDAYAYGGVTQDVDSHDYEIIEVIDSRQYVDRWINANDKAVDFGPIPLEEGEILPSGALDDEDPDEQRLTEATGNEGATYERSYHRAALVVWPLDRFADVLFQAGVGAVLPYLEDRIREYGGPSAPAAERERVIALARRVADAWDPVPDDPMFEEEPEEADRAQMIGLLGRLGEADLLEQFVDRVVQRAFDGSENEALAANARLLGPETSGTLLSRLVGENVALFHNACVDLLGRVVNEFGREAAPAWTSALREIGARVVDALPDLSPTFDGRHSDVWWRADKAKAVDAAMVADLLDHLAALDAPSLRGAAAAAMAVNTRVFDPRDVVVPALELLHQRPGERGFQEPDFVVLWQHAAEFLLAKSEFPPEPPHDWRQEVTIECDCEDCQDLQSFARDPKRHIHRFRVREDRRRHLHGAIDRHQIDVTHVTERKGSPHTLVCTKTVRTFEGQCEQHREDVTALVRLAKLLPPEFPTFPAHLERIQAASERSPQPFVAP